MTAPYCANGQHGVRYFGPVRSGPGDTIQADVLCGRCGKVIVTRVWTKEQWAKRMALGKPFPTEVEHG